MTLCPIALATGCAKCPVFKVCPLKGVIGDYQADGVKTRQQGPGDTNRK